MGFDIQHSDDRGAGREWEVKCHDCSHVWYVYTSGNEPTIAKCKGCDPEEQAAAVAAAHRLAPTITAISATACVVNNEPFPQAWGQHDAVAPIPDGLAAAAPGVAAILRTIADLPDGWEGLDYIIPSDPETDPSILTYHQRLREPERRRLTARNIHFKISIDDSGCGAVELMVEQKWENAYVAANFLATPSIRKPESLEEIGAMVSQIISHPDFQYPPVEMIMENIRGLFTKPEGTFIILDSPDQADITADLPPAPPTQDPSTPSHSTPSTQQPDNPASLDDDDLEFEQFRIQCMDEAHASE